MNKNMYVYDIPRHHATNNNHFFFFENKHKINLIFLFC